jgi:hypothetical protein
VLHPDKPRLVVVDREHLADLADLAPEIARFP